ncbi:hypothetical protein [Desulfamplus magnetovallimortis]|uniref:hypothetical protein n=1 Tax=Desulfamplus magnetovallimortis TaxID=1246637 RepID=UPI0009BBF9BD|nr:hypothetical protein [Desulfamplus magnetovallimortis]
MKNLKRDFTKSSAEIKKMDKTIQLWGWSLFILSSLFFIASSIKSGDILSLGGGVLFFVACIVFLIPFFRMKG